MVVNQIAFARENLNPDFRVFHPSNRVIWGMRRHFRGYMGAYGPQTPENGRLGESIIYLRHVVLYVEGKM